MTDQVQSPEAGAQPQETTAEVDNPTTLEQMQQEEQQVDQAQEEPKAQKVVPLAALHEERSKVKELREKQRVMEERFNQLQTVVTQRLTPQQQRQEVQIPDIAQDPVAHFQAQNVALRQQLESLGRPVQEITQRMAQQEQYQRVKMHVGSQEAEFSKEKPDYAEAVNHAQQADMQALKALGYDEMTARNMVVQQYDQLTIQLINQGKNIPESIYAFAQSKGYQPKAAGQASAQERLQNTQRVNQAARSLGGGAGVATRVSLTALADMPADEFAKTIGGDETAWKKLWGG